MIIIEFNDGTALTKKRVSDLTPYIKHPDVISVKEVSDDIFEKVLVVHKTLNKNFCNPYR